jgi:hypothetical protein
MSEPDDVLDLENPPHFNPDKWIGKGRAYPAKPEDVPRELSLYCDHLLKIPLQKETVVRMALYLSINKSCSAARER